MEQLFRDLVTKCWWSWISLLAFLIAGVMLFGGALNNDQQFGTLTICYFGLCGFFAYPLITAAYAGKKHILTVCVWSFVLVVAGVGYIHYSFYLLTAKEGVAPAHYDKFLNVVPVLVAIWAAAVGWFVHFRLTTSAHRTNNAFVITMEMVKSAEFLKRQEIVSKHFPPGTHEIPVDYHPFFPGSSLRDALNAVPPSPKNVEKAEAIYALKYILNFYEFMAVGIKKGDLDEELVYDTNSVQVVNLFTRANAFIEYVNKPGPIGAGQPLAFCELRTLVNRWRVRIQEDTARR